MNHPANLALRKKLIEAAREGNLALLREHVSELPNARAYENGTVLHFSAANGHLECLDFISLAHPPMMRMQDEFGWIPLHWACEEGHLSVVSLLIERDSHTMKMTDYERLTPLHMACSNDHLSIVSLLLEKCPDAELSLSVRTNDGETLLQRASYFGQIEVSRLLLSMIPSPANQQDALSAAVFNRESFTAAISLLPVLEWQRQLGLQDEFLDVEITLSILEREEEPGQHHHHLNKSMPLMSLSVCT